MGMYKQECMSVCKYVCMYVCTYACMYVSSDCISTNETQKDLYLTEHVQNIYSIHISFQ